MARRRNNSPLLWALLTSALINHAVFLPAAYFLLYEKPRVEPEVVEVDLVPDEQQPRTPLVLPKLPPPPRERPPRVRPRPKKKPKALAKKKAPKPDPPKPKPKPKQQQPPPPEPEPTMRMKMVEVNNPESETPPDDARFLSDKNRRVEQETRARQTNLVKDHPKPKPVSRPNKLPKPEPGAKKQKIADLRRRKAKKPKPKQVPRTHPLLVMRAPVKPLAAKPEQKPLAQQTPDGQLPAPSPRQQARARRKRIDLNLNHRSHDRIYGKEARRQRELARLSPSAPKGSHQKKWERIRSSLENFIPEVRPGNQTALGTRAHPFALYIARMHRKIHRLWGFGFLVDMDNKPDRHPMNDMKLWTMVEVVVEPSGKVHKATIVRPSGVLTYDVAALDTVFAGGPYPPTPRAIRSKDGKVYLHWRFHRNQRQCGTFGVDPFILTKPPTGPIDSTLAEVGGRPGPGRAGPRRLNRPFAGRPGQPHSGHRHKHHAAGSGHARQQSPRSTAPSKRQLEAARAAAQKDVRAELGQAARAAKQFIEAFDRRDAAAMAAASALPFLAQGRKVAKRPQVLRRMFEDLVREGKGPRSTGVRLMTVSEARKKLGKLPAGADYGAGMVVGQVQLGRVPVTLLLQKRAGSWKVIGLNR